MKVAFGLLLFFGGPLALLVGLIKPSLYRGGRLRAVAIGFAISTFGLVASMLATSPEEWQSMRVEREAREAVEGERRAQEQRESEARQAADRAREYATRAQIAPQVPPPAPARQRGPDRLRALGSAQVVFIWKNGNALSESHRLFDAGVHRNNPTLIMSLTSCVVDPGTQVVVTSGGFARSDILVISGPQSGCRGTIPNEWIESGR